MLQLRFFKVLSVSSTDGQMESKVWWRMWWSDLRLSWDPADYGGITEISFNAAGRSFPEDTEIWLPDVQPYNAIDGLMHSFDPADAIVTSHGQVSWSRPGILKVMCRFSGLVSFPYGEMSCPIEIGGWRLGGRLQGLTSADTTVTATPGCVNFDSTEETSLPAYQEVALSRIECSEHLYRYELAPDDPYPVIKYRVYINRSSSYYTLTTLVPSILFTLLSFAPFFMSYQVGERLGVGVTLVLTIEISRTSLQTVLPICGEWLWLEIIFQLNMLFTIISLLESCLVLGLAFTTVESLIPPAVYQVLNALSGRGSEPRRPRENESLAGKYLRGIKRDNEKLRTARSPLPSRGLRSQRKDGSKVSSFNRPQTPPPSPPGPPAATSLHDVADDCGAQDPHYPRLPELTSFDAEVAHSGARLIDALTAPAPEDGPEDGPQDQLEGGPEDGLAPAARDEAPDGSDQWPAQAPLLVRTSSQQNSPCALRRQVASGAGLVARLDTKLEDERTKGNQASKLIFFENLFFNLDVDGGGSITFDEMRRMLAFTALSMTTEEREAALREADTDLSDGKLTRGEFMDLCVQHLSEHSLEELEAAARSYAEFRQALKRRANTYWVGIAGRIDWHARFWIPFAYMTIFSVLWSVELKDSYITPKADNATYVPGTYQAVAKNASIEVSTYTVMAGFLDAVSVESMSRSSLGNTWIFVGSTMVVAWVLWRCRETQLSAQAIKIQARTSTTTEKYAKRLLVKQKTMVMSPQLRKHLTRSPPASPRTPHAQVAPSAERESS